MLTSWPLQLFHPEANKHSKTKTSDVYTTLLRNATSVYASTTNKMRWSVYVPVPTPIRLSSTYSRIRSEPLSTAAFPRCPSRRAVIVSQTDRGTSSPRSASRNCRFSLVTESPQRARTALTVGRRRKANGQLGSMVRVGTGQIGNVWFGVRSRILRRDVSEDGVFRASRNMMKR